MYIYIIEDIYTHIYISMYLEPSDEGGYLVICLSTPHCLPLLLIAPRQPPPPDLNLIEREGGREKREGGMKRRMEGGRRRRIKRMQYFTCQEDVIGRCATRGSVKRAYT